MTKQDGLISEERRRFILGQIISFFNKEREEKIGIIAAEMILDFFIQTIGADLYNKGVEDSKELLKNSLSNLELDIGALIKK